MIYIHPQVNGLTNRWHQLLQPTGGPAVQTFKFMKQLSKFATLAPATSGSAPSR